MPVINNNKELVGLLSWSDIKNHINEIEESTKSVQNFMKDELITITKDKPFAEAKRLMLEHNVSCLPVVKGKNLVGILTSNDL
jgi:predicted transcriptional regulator